MNPDLIVGVDLGTTFTGVSYWRSITGQIVDPLVINKWPGLSNKVANKVPTVIAFAETTMTWGFEINQRTRDDSRNQIEEHFKLLLNREYLNQVNPGDTILVTTERVQGWFEKFLTKLYDWTSKELKALTETNLEDMKVEYIFSVPAAWEEETISDYLRIIKQAGFGSVDDHKASIGLNEAEAAAVQTAIYNPKLPAGYQPGNTVLVCDAGGGTTDVSVLKVTDVLEKVPQFIPLCRIDAAHIGSVMIDEAFNELVNNRLRPLQCEVKNAASGEEFQAIKHNVGTDSVDLLDDFNIKIPGLKKDIEDSRGMISKGRMRFSRHEIEGLFNDILPGICELINKQLEHVKSIDANANVDYIILSGGLGSSKYIQRHLIQRYVKDSPGSDKKGVKILIADDPQTVVCRGLVLDRIHQIFHVKPIISHRCSRASYGFVFDMPYDKEKHKQSKRERIKLKVDGRYYLPGRINWFINRDEPVECGRFITVPFSRNVDFKHPGILRHDIVKFDGKPEDRPDKFDSDPKLLVCKIWCNLESTLREMKRVKRYKHGFAMVRWGEYLNVTYDVLVAVESNGLKFQLLLDGQTSGSVEEIEVDWTKELNTLVVEVQSDMSSSISVADTEAD
ncbi:actin-like ATPase domain-containing protein [Wilcoxina mikolae CBS 423.85]|nr:actin-like ATPase domain-containing protein [Wilcoxina mikolae CBS 423.85]